VTRFAGSLAARVTDDANASPDCPFKMVAPRFGIELAERRRRSVLPCINPITRKCQTSHVIAAQAAGLHQALAGRRDGLTPCPPSIITAA
jgi:hypothetical protein